MTIGQSPTAQVCRKEEDLQGWSDGVGGAAGGTGDHAVRVSGGSHEAAVVIRVLQQLPGLLHRQPFVLALLC